MQALEAVVAAIEQLTGSSIIAGDVTAQTLSAAYAALTRLVAEDIRTGTVQADSLSAAAADVVSAAMRTLDVDYAHVRDLDADEAIITDGVAGALLIERLAASSAMMASATLGELVIRGDDGGYYQVTVQAGGTVGVAPVTVTEDEIAAAQTNDGRKIVETAIDVGSLNAGELRAQSAVIADIFTQALTAGKITAGQALLSSASIPELYTTAIKAIGDSIDLSANALIRMLVGTADYVNAVFSFSSEGLRTRIRRADGTYSKWSTMITENGFYIDHEDVQGHVGAFHEDLFEPRSIRMGNLTAKPSGNGWCWSVAANSGEGA